MSSLPQNGGPPRGRAKVLVVDDEPAIGDIVSRYLQRAGYDTAVAATGTDALRHAEGAGPDVVVLDLMLPDIDGLEVMRRLRRAHHQRAAIILLTARGEESDRITGLRLGAVLGLLAVVAGEMLGALEGVGQRLARSAEGFQAAEAFAWILLTVLMVMLVNGSLSWLERRVAA